MICSIDKNYADDVIVNTHSKRCSLAIHIFSILLQIMSLLVLYYIYILVIVGNFSMPRGTELRCDIEKKSGSKVLTFDITLNNIPTIISNLSSRSYVWHVN